MWLHRFTDYLLRNRWQALAMTFLITFVPVVGILGILIATLITLVKGMAEGALFVIAASLPFLIGFYFSGVQEPTLPLFVWAGIGVAILGNVLTWVFAVMLRKHSSWSVILQVAALLGVFTVSVAHLAYPDLADWWGDQLLSFYQQAAVATQGAASDGATIPTDLQKETINITKQYATGLMVAAILFNALAQLVAARWWQGLVFSPKMLRRELHGIRFSQLAGFLFLTSLVFWYLGNSVVLDIMPILYLVFGAAGLSLIHYLFGLMKSPSTWFWILLLYISLIIALPVSAEFVALIALLDIWLDVRKRVKKV